MTGEWEAESALRSLLHRFMEGRHGAHGGGYETPRLRNVFAASISPENAVGMQGGSGNGTAAANSHGGEEVDDVVDDEIGEF